VNFRLLEVVDFRSRLLAFRGAGGEPHSYVSRISVSPAHLSRRSLASCAPINVQRGIKNKILLIYLLRVQKNQFNSGSFRGPFLLTVRLLGILVRLLFRSLLLIRSSSFLCGSGRFGSRLEGRVQGCLLLLYRTAVRA
jgi:hypothetical protein